MPRTGTNEVSDDEIATKLRDLGDGKRPPSRSLFNSDSIAASSAEVEERFGSWKRGIEIAGYDPTEDPITPEENSDRDSSKQRSSEEKTDKNKGSRRDSKNKTDDSDEERDENNQPEKTSAQKGGQSKIDRGSKTLSEEVLIEKIERLAEDGTAPTLSEFTDKVTEVSSSEIYKRFNSWTTLVEKTSLSPRTRGKSYEYTEKELLNQIKRASDGDTAPTTTEFETNNEGASVATVHNRFGSWSEAIKQTNLEPNNKRNKREKTKEELLEELNQYADDGRCPTIKSMRRDNARLVTDIINRFGRWTKAAKEAGLKTNKRGSNPKYTRQEIEEQIKSLSKNGNPPTVEEFNAADHTATMGPIRRIFNTWSNALTEMGYDHPRTSTQISEEEILNQIQMVGGEESTPTASEFDDNEETHSVGCAVQKFGSWNNAVRQAGYEPNEKKST